MEEITICPDCGAEVVHKKGISKAGNAYELYKCSKAPACKFVKWISSFPKNNAPAGAPAGVQRQDNIALNEILIRLNDIEKELKTLTDFIHGQE